MLPSSYAMALRSNHCEIEYRRVVTRKQVIPGIVFFITVKSTKSLSYFFTVLRLVTDEVDEQVVDLECTPPGHICWVGATQSFSS